MYFLSFSRAGNSAPLLFLCLSDFPPHRPIPVLVFFTLLFGPTIAFISPTQYPTFAKSITANPVYSDDTVFLLHIVIILEPN